MEKITLVSSHNGIYSLDSNAGTILQTFKDCSASKFSVSYVGNSTKYLAGFQANKSTLHIWSNKSDPTYRVSLPEIIKCCEFQDDGGVVYAGGLSGTVYIWVITTGQLLNCWLSHYKPINKIKLVQNNSILVTCSDDCYIQAFLTSELLESNNSLTFPKPLIKWNAHSASINDFFPLSFANNFSNLSIVSIGGDFSLNFLTLRSEKPLANLNFSTQLHSCTSSDCGKLVFIGGGNGIIYKIYYNKVSSLNFNHISKLLGHSGPVKACICSNNKLFSSANDGVRIWDIIAGTCISQLPQFGDGILSILNTKLSIGYLSLSIPLFKPLQRNISKYCNVIGISIPTKDRRSEIKNEIYYLSNGIDAICYLDISLQTYNDISQKRKSEMKSRMKSAVFTNECNSNNIIKLALEKCILLESSRLRSNFCIQKDDNDFRLLRSCTIPYSKFKEIKTKKLREEKKNQVIHKNFKNLPKIKYKFIKSCGIGKFSKKLYLRMLLRKKYSKLSRH
ncbi:WD repeat [Cryptosporidium sp. chipmunk genotype I]|uniref:WD repeat n=1 Tax=Cryptosporidium sp. chipmunk genotype I TaxID=1280935 RepID=UPI00351A8722|nr:WD repeat [Cryptosporidium sp. chipmunk genotype I]